ncbi:hypothetical protein DVW12_16255 [Clostridium botulinum]|nr:hypothetical protein [Clostridium botulinum]
MFNQMKYICENEYNNFLSLPNVNGIAIGHKTVKGIDTGVICLKVLVENKVDENTLKKDEKIPKIYNGVITDVIEVGVLEAYANTSKVRPTEGGISIGVAGSSTAGTLGCLVSTGAGSNLKTYVLSNNHVMALTNTAPIGSLILQPAQGDGGANPGDGIANLSQFVNIDFTTGSTNTVDCAIAEVSNLSLVSPSIISIGNISSIASAVIGGFVQKSGRTTGYTTGTISGVNATLNISYGSFGSAIFVNQIITSAMSSSGDSGSIVLDSSNRVIGLLFAGSSSITGLNDIRNVLKSFRARLV